jgi:hypothetical protein
MVAIARTGYRAAVAAVAGTVAINHISVAIRAHAARVSASYKGGQHAPDQRCSGSRHKQLELKGESGKIRGEDSVTLIALWVIGTLDEADRTTGAAIAPG